MVFCADYIDYTTTVGIVDIAAAVAIAAVAAAVVDVDEDLLEILLILNDNGLRFALRFG